MTKVVDALKSIGRFFFSPKGRLQRIPYAVGFVIVELLIVYVSRLGSRYMDYYPDDTKGLLFVFAVIGLYIPFLILFAKRLHDIGWNTWIIWLVAPAFVGWFVDIPVLNVGEQMILIIALAALFAKGETKENRYGPVPKSWWPEKSLK